MPATDVFSAGSTALISGGASGIGLSLAKFCRHHGMNVLIADRNKDALAQAEKDLSEGEKSSAQVVTAVTDVSKLSDWETLRDLATAKFRTIELLVLNAGRQAKGSWGDIDYFRDTLETNLFGVINGLNAFLPVVQNAAESKPTSIIITGSKQGITNPPGNPAYNASKAAVKSLAEQLSWDMKESSTSVHLLVPGWTYTTLTGASLDKEKPAGAWFPAQVVEHLYKKMGEDAFYIICPDEDVSEDTDKRRMLWSVGDVVYERPPLSRWREEWKQKAKETMAKTNI